MQNTIQRLAKTLINLSISRRFVHTPLVLFIVAAITQHIDSQSVHAESNKRPNIVFVMADDLGIGDVKCFGGETCNTQTPNIDALAASGMRFTDAHAIASVCVPTRIAIMTGRYPWRFDRPRPDGIWGFLRPRIPSGQLTLGHMMRSAGYQTGYVGKWHLGTTMQTKDGKIQGSSNVDFTKPLTNGPVQHGFDFSFILPGSLDMFPYVFVENNHFVGKVTEQRGWSAFNRVGPTAQGFEDFKVLNEFSTKAEHFIQRAATEKNGKPFFLFFALTSPHTPTSPSPKFAGKTKLGLYGDFVLETDDCVGRVVAALKNAGVEKNTIVIFTSDHGPASYAGNIRKATAGQLIEMEKNGEHDANGIYRGYKFSVYEGGLRVPYIVHWPGVTKGGSQCDRLIGLNDLMRTMGDIAGYEFREHEAPDSISFKTLLSNPTKEPTRDVMILESVHAHAVRRGDWKLCICPGSGARGVYGNVPKSDDAWSIARKTFGRKPTREEVYQSPFVQLFNLKTDPTESNNVAGENPRVVSELVQLLRNQIASGRSTPGKPLKNDIDRTNFRHHIPRFVFE